VRARAIGLVLLLATMGCRQILGLDDLEDLRTDGSVDDADSAIDAPIPDASGCVALSSECVSGSVLRTCNALGEDPVDTTCTLTCSAAGGAHCTQIAPAGGAATAADLAPSPPLTDVTIAAATTINGDDGTITGLRATGNGVVSGIDYTVRNNVAVFRFKKLAVNAAVQLRGARPIVLVALEDITVGAPIDAHGPCTALVPGPGGGAGGMQVSGAAMAGGDPGGGPGGAMATGLAGAGGGNGAVGGAAGKMTGTSPGGGAAFGTPTIPTLRGGGGGGGGVGQTSGAGGGGGGAVQLVANGKIELTAGGINAGGCGGFGGFFAGGGGGAGGTILLEAATITIGTGVYLAVNGGGGGGSGGSGGVGTNGMIGQSTTGRAPPGTGAQGGVSGRGGAAGFLAGESGADDNMYGGAGGGAVGRIRINTLSGAATIQAGAIVSPSLAETPTTTTQGMLVVQ
jgi:hypothetical protein